MNTNGNTKRESGNWRLKIGGMALENGVLFQTERHWAMAVRRPDGGIGISSGAKLLPAPLARLKKFPLLRGLLSLAETAAVLPNAHAHGGELPALVRSPQMMASMLIGVVGTVIIRNPKKKLPPLVEEIAASALTLIPALVAMRKTRAVQYHAAEHMSINAYENAGVADESHAAGSRAEHARCGSNVIGPALLMMTAGNALSRRYLRRRSNIAHLGVGVLSISGAVELVQWAARHPKSPLSRLLVGAGEELQHILTTSEPSRDQLEVSLTALNELLRLEGAL